MKLNKGRRQMKNRGENGEKKLNESKRETDKDRTKRVRRDNKMRIGHEQ